jgi:hypothetical protein
MLPRGLRKRRLRARRVSTRFDSSVRQKPRILRGFCFGGVAPPPPDTFGPKVLMVLALVPDLCLGVSQTIDSKERDSKVLKTVFEGHLDVAL